MVQGPLLFPPQILTSGVLYNIEDLEGELGRIVTGVGGWAPRWLLCL